MIAQAIKNHVKRVWKGEEPFWKVFLIWWIAGTFLVVTGVANALMFFSQNNIHLPASWYPYIPIPPTFILIPAYFIFITFIGIKSLHVKSDELKTFLILSLLLLFCGVGWIFFILILLTLEGSTYGQCKYGFCMWSIAL